VVSWVELSKVAGNRAIDFGMSDFEFAADMRIGVTAGGMSRLPQRYFGDPNRAL
jgi:hypothetical protein